MLDFFEQHTYNISMLFHFEHILLKVGVKNQVFFV